MGLGPNVAQLTGTHLPLGALCAGRRCGEPGGQRVMGGWQCIDGSCDSQVGMR